MALLEITEKKTNTMTFSSTAILNVSEFWTMILQSSQERPKVDFEFLTKAEQLCNGTVNYSFSAVLRQNRDLDAKKFYKMFRCFPLD